MRRGYVAFESDIRAGASEVYVHGMPGGQYTNLREQARSLGIEDHRWPEVAQAYAEVNEMFGDIVKVTPTSKVVGDMAIMMVTSGLTRRGGARSRRWMSRFRNRWCSCSAATWASPPAAFRAALQQKMLQGTGAARGARRASSCRPRISTRSAPRAEAQDRPRGVTDFELASYLMYPKVFADYAADRAQLRRREHACRPRCSSTACEPGQEINIDLERGKTLIVRYVTTSDVHEDGTRTVFFELNGQPRPDPRARTAARWRKRPPRRKAEAGHAKHVGAPMPGTIAHRARARRPDRDAAAMCC